MGVFKNIMGILNSRFFSRVIGVAIVGLVCLIMGLTDLIGALSFKNDIKNNILNSENIIDDMYQSDYKLNENICGNIYYLYECFCEETTTNTVNGIKTSSRVSGSYYLMPITNFENDYDDNIYYVTVLAKDKDFTANCELLVEDTYDFLMGDDNVNFHDCIFYGKVKPLEDDVKEYLVEWVKDVELFDDNSAATIDKYILPFELEQYNIDNHLRSAKFLIPIGIAFIAFCVVIFIIRYKNESKQTEDAALNSSYEPFNTPQPTSSNASSSYNLSYKPEEPQEPKVLQPVPAEKPKYTPPVTDETSKKTVSVSNTVPAEDGMLSANVSDEELNSLPDDSAAKPVYNYDDGGMGGIDVSALDLSSLDDYSENDTSDNTADDNIYSSDDDDYTFDADPSSIQLSDMDK